MSFSFENPCIVASADAPSHRTHNFYRSARWAPDGSSFLAHAEDRSLALFKLPRDILQITEPISLQPTMLSKGPTPLVAYAWYPRATIVDELNWTFVRSIRDHPVHLINAGTGKVQGTYPIIDHTEQFISPHSLCFSPDGSYLYSGHENAIEIHDLERSGDIGERIATSPSRRSKDGQKGIISSISISTSSWHSSLLCAGSFSRSAALYDASSSYSVTPIQVVPIPGGGVSQVQFHPTLPLLMIASRISNEILVYDVRNLSTPEKPLYRLKRNAKTNQRIDFAIESWGRGVVSGDKDGNVHYWDITTTDQEDIIIGQSSSSTKLSNDAIGHASVHPYYPLLLTASGSRKFTHISTITASPSSSFEEEEDRPAQPLESHGRVALWNVSGTDASGWSQR